jgi:hypothetical protein
MAGMPEKQRTGLTISIQFFGWKEAALRQGGIERGGCVTFAE